MAITNKTPRVFYRKENNVFRVSFFADVNKTIPLVPIDIGLYPAFTIYDINDVVVQSGVGQPEASPGTYKVEFLVPSDAPLSYDGKRWRIEWVLVSVDNNQFDFVEEFDVRDVVITASTHREQKFITLCSNPTQMMVRRTRRPYNLSVGVYPMGSGNIPPVATANLSGGGIVESVDGDSYIYSITIPGSALSMGNTSYNILWSVQETASDVPQFLYQNLTSVTPNALMMVTSVRMLIDKFQKRLGTVQAYEDSDIIEYLQRGTELVNSVYPTTYYNLGYTPGGFNVFTVLFAAWYGLNAQQILEIDLGFSFSGQTVTLDYDHASGLADVMGRWSEFINQNLPALKMSTIRRTSAVGAVAGRGYRINSPFAFTYKIGSNFLLDNGSANNVVGQLNHLGLLF